MMNRPYAKKFTDPSLARQSEKDQCDINLIIKRFEKTGILPSPTRQPIWADTTTLPDFREMMDTVTRGTAAFERLPAQVRDYFSNDPARFYEFAADEQNIPELRRLGILPEDTPPEQPPEAAT